jgi:hypothetical protein
MPAWYSANGKDERACGFMQVSTNKKLIARRRRIGTYASFGGLGVLLAGMIASFQVQYIWYSLIALVAGFLLAQFGNYNLRRWGRSPRPDEVIEIELKGFDERYHLYSWSLPAPFVLLSPQGVYTFVTRDQGGEITVNGSQWKSKFTIGRVLLAFAQEGLGNPSGEALEGANRMTKWIEEELPEVAAGIQPAVVFINKQVKLQITDPAVPVLDAPNLKKWLRGAGKGANLKSADYKALEALFNARTESVSK